MKERGKDQFKEHLAKVVKRMTRLSVDQRLDTGRESDDLTSMAKRFSSDIEGKFNKARVFSKQPKRTVLKKLGQWISRRS